MHMVLLEMHTAPQKQCETILLVQSVFLKMSERKHSDSEFYYRSELSGAEMAYQMYCGKTLAL